MTKTQYIDNMTISHVASVPEPLQRNGETRDALSTAASRLEETESEYRREISQRNELASTLKSLDVQIERMLSEKNKQQEKQFRRRRTSINVERSTSGGMSLLMDGPSRQSVSTRSRSDNTANSEGERPPKKQSWRSYVRTGHEFQNSMEVDIPKDYDLKDFDHSEDLAEFYDPPKLPNLNILSDNSKIEQPAGQAYETSDAPIKSDIIKELHDSNMSMQFEEDSPKLGS